MSAIAVHGLTKRFGSVTAVDDLSFAVQAGTVTGFVGPNGSGKSTTLRTILGLVRPDAGTAVVDGRPYRELEDPTRHIGAVLEPAFHPARTAANHLRAVATAAGIAPGPGSRGPPGSRPRTRGKPPRRRILNGHAPASGAGD